MPKTETKTILWQNVSVLMQREYGGENLSRLARETGIGPGGSTRLKNQESSAGLDILEAIAARFRVMPWQLLAPELGAALYYVEAGKLIPSFIVPPPDIAPDSTRQITNPRKPGEVEGKRRDVSKRKFDTIVTPKPRKKAS